MTKVTIKSRKSWQDINWKDANSKARKLQLDIVSAYNNKNQSKVIALQEQLVRSFCPDHLY